MIARKGIGVLFWLNIIALSAFSQDQRLVEDSIMANELIIDKLKSLEESGVKKIVHLYSNVGTIAIVYEKEGKIKGVKSYYRGKRKSIFKNLNLSKADKSDFIKLMEITPKDTPVNFSYCIENVHAFTRNNFVINANGRSVKGVFTSDCKGELAKNGMLPLYNFYVRFLYN